MIKVKDLKIDARATLGDALLLCRTSPTYAYDSSGQPTSVRDGTRYLIASPALGMSTVNVKVRGEQTVDLGKRPTASVVFEKLELYLYQREGRWYVGGRAQAIREA